MQFNRKDLISAAAKAGITQDKAELLWNELNTQSAQQQTEQKFDLSRLLYYFGAMLVIIALSWFLTETWERFGGQGIFWTALIYISIFFVIGTLLWSKSSLTTPGGIFITLAVCVVPLAVYGLQQWTGWWPDDKFGHYRDFYSWIAGQWFIMEITTLIVGSIAFYFFRFPFLMMPIFFTLWFMSMDIIPLIGNETNIDAIRKQISIVFGLIVLIIAYVIDLKSEKDFAFWPYFFGVLMFWSGISLLEPSSEYGRFIYLIINLVLMLLSVLLQRVVFLVFGAIGVLMYISSIFYKYFSESLGFPIILSIIGIAIVFLGILYQRKYQKIETWIMNLLPASVKNWLPKH